MKLTMKLLAMVFGALMLANIANAETPRQQLQQMVVQLQSNPSDDVLREKIIKLAQKLKPAPAVPEEAIKYEGRGKFAFKNAKSNDDYLDAAKEFEQAANTAPWVPGYYSDLCTIHEKVGNYAVAKRNCEIYLTAITSQAELAETKERIAGLEYAIEKMAKQKNQGEEFLKKLDGAKFARHGRDNFNDGTWAVWRQLYVVRGNMAFWGYVIDSTNDNYRKNVGEIIWAPEGYLITGREFLIPKIDQLCIDFQQRCFDETQSISEDGNKITQRRTYAGKLEESIYLREK